MIVAFDVIWGIWAADGQYVPYHFEYCRDIEMTGSFNSIKMI